MNKLRIGIVGAGRIGNVHAESITYHVPEAEVAMVTDVMEESAKKLAERFGVPKYSADYMDIINDPEIDAVLVCSPTPTHADITIAALKAGKHVFCEKPVHTSIEKIEEVAKVAEETGKKLQIGFNRRFDHNHKAVQRLAQNGSLGRIELIKITSRDPEPPSPEYAASSGGLYIDMMIHDFDMAMFLASSDVTEVYAMGTSLVDPRIGEAGDVDTAIVTLVFENGALGVIDNSRRAAYGYDQRVEAFGSLGMAADENDGDSTVKVSTALGVVGEKPQFFFLERYMASFTEEMKQFIAAIVNDTEVPVGIHAGLMSVVLAKAAKKSLDEHRPVKISEIYQA
ncbi:MAG: inositol 2-dehydrogenase [Clostridia bacterium]|nr:inositol 2-dehydrogenase [Clostridia bacterium]MBR1684854.1 inositol 2-dehydrogenase [Clostridia bacterium]MBR2288748.1 inositol 2-dehydrogenase [Clostridia bacterium]